MKLIVPPLEISAMDGFLPEIDIFNRKPYGENLLNLISNTDGELVIALDAPWGEGKSTFIKMWRGYLSQQKVSHIYFDAFENDYQQDPFLALSAQIYNMIDDADTSTQKEFSQKAVSAIKVIGRAGLRLGLKTLTAGILDDSILDGADTIDDAGDEISSAVDKYIENQLKKVDRDRESLEAFKVYLSGLSEKMGSDKPIIFIIDELDRCKPKFSLAIIESIKHLFSVSNVVFLLVMNREQMQESVRAEYGQGVDSSRYLQKFISLWTSLPKKRGEAVSFSKKYIDSCMSKMNFVHHDAAEYFNDLSVCYDLSYREIEKSLTNCAVVINAHPNGMNEDAFLLTIFLSVIKVKNINVYRNFSSESISYDELLNVGGVSKLVSKYWGGDSERHKICWLLKYYLSDDDQLRSVVSGGNHSCFAHHHRNKKMIKGLCDIMDSFVL